MPLWSDLHPTDFPLIQRVWLDRPGSYNLVAPTGTAFVRAAAAGCGGFKDDADGWGGGAAFAFNKEAAAAGATFTAQVGDPEFSRPSANTTAGDSWVKRSNATNLVYADRGRPDGSAGLAANSTGLTTRSGSAATGSAGGAGAGDAGDTAAMGFGGRGANPGTSEANLDALAAWYGGGGGRRSARQVPIIPAGCGLVCVEFYTQDPRY